MHSVYKTIADTNNGKSIINIMKLNDYEVMLCWLVLQYPRNQYTAIATSTGEEYSKVLSKNEDMMGNESHENQLGSCSGRVARMWSGLILLVSLRNL